MIIQKTTIVGLAAAFALTFAGPPAHAGKDREPAREQPPPEVAKPDESALAAVDAALREQFKEYVGLSLQKEGAVLLTLSKGADLDAAANLAREAWIKATRKELREYLPHFAFVDAVASPEELKSAVAKLRDVLTIKDVVFLDLDEACGCIRVGIAQKEAATLVARFVTEHEVTAQWVQTVFTPQIRRTADLTSKFRPTMGGVAIWTSGKDCTLGLPTYSFTQHAYGILTASHCTQGPQGDAWATSFIQGTSFTNDWIADESLDLRMFDNAHDSKCPVGRLCRYSDAVFANYAQPALGITGRVMRPASSCVTAGGSCSLSVTRPTDDIRVLFATTGLFTGTSVDKVGAKSGWTRGAITGTCADINVVDVDAAGTVTDTGMTLLCQTRVDTTSLPGDSGSPVFEFHSNVGGGVFAGILWGGAIDGTSMIYSPIDGIELDLGGFVYNQMGVSGTWFSNGGQFYTSNVNDQLAVTIERNVVPAGEVQFVLNSGPNISQRKEIVLVEGPAVGTGRWTIATNGPNQSAADGLYMYQLPGGILEFRKSINGAVSEVSRVPIDTIPSGTRITFTWQTE